MHKKRIGFILLAGVVVVAAVVFALRYAGQSPRFEKQGECTPSVISNYPVNVDFLPKLNIKVAEGKFCGKNPVQEAIDDLAKGEAASFHEHTDMLTKAFGYGDVCGLGHRPFVYSQAMPAWLRQAMTYYNYALGMSPQVVASLGEICPLHSDKEVGFFGNADAVEASIEKRKADMAFVEKEFIARYPGGKVGYEADIKSARDTLQLRLRVAAGDMDFVRAYKGNLFAWDSDNHTALVSAMRSPHTDMLDYLLTQSPPAAAVEDLIKTAIAEKTDDAVVAVLNRVRKAGATYRGETMAIQAVAHREPKALAWLHAQGVPLNGYGLLRLAVGQPTLHGEYEQGDAFIQQGVPRRLQMAQFLLDHGVDIKDEDKGRCGATCPANVADKYRCNTVCLPHDNLNLQCLSSHFTPFHTLVLDAAGVPYVSNKDVLALKAQACAVAAVP